jgi:hypothetical protein
VRSKTKKRSWLDNYDIGDELARSQYRTAGTRTVDRTDGRKICCVDQLRWLNATVPGGARGSSLSAVLRGTAAHPRALTAGGPSTVPGAVRYSAGCNGVARIGRDSTVDRSIRSRPLFHVSGWARKREGPMNVIDVYGERKRR